MRVFHILLFSTALLTFSAAQAEQESPFTGGMKYTTVSKSKITPKSTNPGHIKQATPNAGESPEATEEETPAAKIWNKYKALAAGTAEETAETTETEEKAVEPAQKETAPPQITGIASIIQKYEKNKQRQSQMQSLDVARPSAPAKPTVETP